MNRKNILPRVVEFSIFGSTLVLLTLTGTSKAASMDQLFIVTGGYDNGSPSTVIESKVTTSPTIAEVAFIDAQ